MKLLFLNTCDAWGGLEMFSGELFDLLRRADVDVRFVLREGTRLESFLEERGHGERLVRTNPAGRYFDRATYSAVRGLVRDDGVDLIHTFKSSDIAFATLPTRFLGKRKPKVLHHLQMLPGHSRKDPLHRVIYGGLSAVATITRQIEDRVRELWPVPASAVRTIYYGLDFGHLEQDEAAIRAARERWGIPEGRRVLGIVGQVCEIKGQRFVLEAFHALRAEHPDLFLVIAGAPVETELDYQRGIDAYIAEHDLADHVRMTGFCDQIPAVMPNFDLFVLGSRQEPFGRVVIEAMVAGCTTVASRAGGVPEIVTDGEDGLLYEPRDAGDLERALRQALAMSDAERSTMRDRARETVLERFSMDRFQAEMIQIYEDVLSGKLG